MTTDTIDRLSRRFVTRGTRRALLAALLGPALAGIALGGAATKGTRNGNKRNGGDKHRVKRRGNSTSQPQANARVTAESQPPPVTMQTPDFHAKSKGHATAPRGCPDGASLCGDATIDGFGPASYRLFITSSERKSERCVTYTATTTFSLDEDSTLTLDEVGEACGTGKTFVKGGERSYGSPRTHSGSWEVQGATGQFAGMTGTGTSTAHFAGAHISTTYTGTLH